MKKLLISTCIFSCFLAFSQNAQPKADSTRVKWQPGPFILGFDIAHAGMSFFTDQKRYQAFLSARVMGRYHGIIEAGYEKNKYEKGGYSGTASGPFIKIGALYQMAVDAENPDNGFLFGLKLAGSPFQQEYTAVPIRGASGQTSTFSLPKKNLAAFWVEAHAGARIELFQSGFFIDVNAGPKIMMYAPSPEGLHSMITPGFGKSSGRLAFDFSWNIGYRF